MAIGLGALALTLAACSTSARALGTVTGTFGHSGGPSVPDFGPGASWPGHPAPPPTTYSRGTVTLTGEGHVYTVRIHDNGSFRLRVPPGHYVAIGRTPSFSSPQPCPGGSVTVRANRTTSAPVTCPIR
jgi:hypothetical protein